MQTVARVTRRPPPGFAPLPVHRGSKSKQQDLKKKLDLQGSDTESTEDEYEGEDSLGELPCPKKSDDRLRRLEQLLASVDELTAIERDIDALTERFGLAGTKTEQPVPARNQSIPAPTPASAPVVATPEDADGAPLGWYRKESSKYKGKFYYVNKKTGETSWKLPKAEAPQVAPTPVFAPPPGLEHMAILKDKMKGGVSEAELSTDCGGLTAQESDYDSDWASSFPPSFPARKHLSAHAAAFRPLPRMTGGGN